MNLYYLILDTDVVSVEFHEVKTKETGIDQSYIIFEGKDIKITDKVVSQLLNEMEYQHILRIIERDEIRKRITIQNVNNLFSKIEQNYSLLMHDALCESDAAYILMNFIL